MSVKKVLASVIFSLATYIFAYNAFIIRKHSHSRDNLKAVNLVKEMKLSDTIKIDTSFGLSSLFRYEIPPKVNCGDILSRNKSVTLVIAYCRHPLHWVADFLNGFEELINEVWVFTKCEMDVVGAPNGSKVFKLPNVGGCDHTYAHAMQMYADLPVNSDHDTVVFLKDTLTIYKKAWGLESQSFLDLLCRAEFYGCGCMLIRVAGAKHMIGGFYAYDSLRTFSLTSWSRKGGSISSINSTEVPFQNENIHNLGDWVDNLSLPIHPTQNLVSVCFGGTFATTKKQILKKPLWVWEAIERSLSRGSNIVEGHYTERTWGPLLSKPLSNATARRIWEDDPFITERSKIELNPDIKKYPAFQ